MGVIAASISEKDKTWSPELWMAAEKNLLESPNEGAFL